MEKITGFLVLFIVFFLIYSYIKYKKELKKNEKKEIVEKANRSTGDQEENYEKHIISAVIASLMDGKKYKIRNIFLEKEKNKETKKSAWKIAGRNYNMQRRDRV